VTLLRSVFYGECNVESKGGILIRRVVVYVFAFSNKQLHARVLAHEYSNEDEIRIDKYRDAAFYAAAKSLPEKSQSLADRSG